MSNLKRQYLRLPEDSKLDPELLALFNDRFRRIEDAFAAQSGHGGDIQAGADIDMRGHRLKNLGKAKQKTDAASVSHVETTASVSAVQALMQTTSLDLTAADGADELFDFEPPGQVQNLTLVWKKKSGWKVHWDEPVNVIKVFGYYVAFFNDGGGTTTWMNPDTGAAAADETSAQRFIHDNVYTTHLDASSIVAPFSVGAKVKVTALVKIKGQGKQRGLPAFYGSIVGPGTDPGAEDVGPPSAVVGLALDWKKKKGWKATWQPPTTNWTAATKYYKVAYSNSGGTHWMVANTGALASPDTEQGATIKVIDTHHTTHLDLSDVNSNFFAGVKVKVTPINTVAGVETAGPSTTSAFVGPGNEDTGPAGPVQNLIVNWKKKRGFKALWNRPLVNANSIVGYKVVFMDNAGTNFMIPDTGQLAASEAAATIRVVGHHYNTHVSYSDLASQFVAGVKAKVIAINIVSGAETDGAAAISNFQAPVNDDPIPTDPASPGNGTLPTPIFKFKRGKLFTKLDMSAVANVNTVRHRFQVSINDGTNSLNIDDPTSETIASGIVYYNHPSAHITAPFDKDQLIRIFGPSALLRASWKITNDQGTTTSPDSATVSLPDKRDITSQYNPVNVLKNGHFTYNNGTAAKVWAIYNPNTGTTSGTLDNTGKLGLDLAQHRARWKNTTDQDDQRFLIQDLGKTFFPNEYWSFSWNFTSNGTLTVDEVQIGLYTAKTLTNTISVTSGQNKVNGTGFDTDGVKVGSIIGEGSHWRTVTAVTATQLTIDRNWTATVGPVTGFAMIPQATRLSQTNLALTTADKFQKGTILTDSDLDVSRKVWFVVVLRCVITGSTFAQLDAIAMNAGQESAGYQRSVQQFETSSGDATTPLSSDFDTAPSGGSSTGGAQQEGPTGATPGTILPIFS